MFIRRPLSLQSLGNGVFNQISQILGPRSNWPLNALFCSSSFSEPPPMPPPENPGPFSGIAENRKSNMLLSKGFTGLGNVGLRSSATRTLFPPGPTDTANQNEAELIKKSKSIDFVREIMEAHGNTQNFSPFGGGTRNYQVETDADIVHVKILRNNTFITVTDSKGNRKFGASAGSLAPGGKVSRFASESTAEHIGREARNRNLKSVVMKVNGFTYFKKKKQSILSFKEGYNHSRGDTNPVVYIEDTTRLPHNGCRRKKQRRI
ncbi:unnamed protein product [Cuscuta epithymum]|uniref:Ribosomal protein S11 n=1 Tax=Cuscuta epithymum TaxID=186058 RepID=A0AAV0FQ35_9ASTE|nr:unnamed protein product [Cuscuta epithymum]